MTPVSRRRTVWAARIVLAAACFAAGIGKVGGRAAAVTTFADLDSRVGLGQGFRIVVGLCETAGAGALLVDPLAATAALALAVVMAGAVGAHVLVVGGSAVPALAVLGLCLFVAWSERATLRTWGVLRTGKGPMDGWVAHAYDHGVQAALRGAFRELAADVLHELADAERILDVGCGPGQFTVLLAEELPRAQLWGVDLAPTMVDLARAHAVESPADERLQFEVADAAALPFPDGNFDAVVSTGSLKHWPDPAAALREIHRVLRRNGRAFVAELNRLAPGPAVEAHRARLRGWLFRLVYPRVFARGLSPAEGRALFAASPFRSVAAERLLLDGCLWMVEARKSL